jgi:hypothetical protein
LASRCIPVASRPATREELLLTHHVALLDAVKDTPGLVISLFDFLIFRVFEKAVISHHVESLSSFLFNYVSMSAQVDGDSYRYFFQREFGDTYFNKQTAFLGSSPFS